MQHTRFQSVRNIQTSQESKQSEGFLSNEGVGEVRQQTEDKLKPTLKKVDQHNWGKEAGQREVGAGTGNLTLSPQVSRFSQTRLRL